MKTNNKIFDVYLEVNQRLKNITTHEIDSKVIVEYIFKLDFARIITIDKSPTPAQVNKINKAVSKRLGGMPLAYITGSKEFYGYNFSVNRHTLIPRPETETLVSEALDLITEYSLLEVVDLGCGSGNIGISIALKSNAKVTLLDVSATALRVAQKNVEKLAPGHSIVLKQSRFLNNYHSRIDLLVANLPYVPSGLINQLKFEPKISLFSGVDGLDDYRILAANLKSKPKFLIIESLPEQQNKLIDIFSNVGYQLLNQKDLMLSFNLR